MKSRPGMRLALAVGMLFSTAICQGSVIELDWGTNASWITGSLSQSFDIDPLNAGNDITIDIAYNGSAQPEGSPVQTTAGNSPNAPELQWSTLDLTDARNVTLTITFHYVAGVSGVTFLTNDVDATTSGVAEVVENILATYQNGSALNVFISAGTTNQVSNNGTPNATLLGTSGSSSVDSNATFSFTDTLDRVEFQFTRAPGANSAGSNIMRLGEISYENGLDEVPEPGTMALLAGGLALLFAARRARS